MKNLKYYKDLNIFDERQLFQIQWGLDDGIDVEIYANPKYDSFEMQEIREKLNKGIKDSYVLSLFRKNKDIECLITVGCFETINKAIEKANELKDENLDKTFVIQKVIKEICYKI